MTTKLSLTVAYAVFSFALCIKTPWGVAAVISAIALFAFVLWSERYTEVETKEIKEKLKELESRINTLNLSRNLGR